jgi:hypothetical protein
MFRNERIRGPLKIIARRDGLRRGGLRKDRGRRERRRGRILI